jgi:DNA modification methylase
MSLAFAEHDVAVWQGDAREQLTLMPAGSVQCAVTSPPYFGLRDYGTGRWEGGGGDCDHKPRKDPTRNIATSTLGGSKGTVGDQQKGYHGRCSRCGAHRVDEQLGLESSPAEYVARIVAVFAEVRRVLAADGVLWLNLGDSYYSGRGNPGPNSADEKQEARRGWVRALDRPGQDWGRPKNLLGMPWRVAFALQDDGWILRNAVVWHKPNAMPESVTDRLSTRYELVFLFSRSRRYWFDLDPIREDRSPATLDRYRYAFQANGNPASKTGNLRDGGMITKANEAGRNPGDVWSIPTSGFPGAHFACMPPALAERCIKAGCPPGGTVLDPFAGSGTTLAAARKLGRKSVGIELNPDYIDLIRGRIGQAPLEFEAAAPVAVQPCVVQDGLDLGDGWPA